jgi:hypothetical protein
VTKDETVANGGPFAEWLDDVSTTNVIEWFEEEDDDEFTDIQTWAELAYEMAKRLRDLGGN